MNTSSGSDPSDMRRISTMRPFFHVVSSVNTLMPITIGNQPPDGIFNALDVRNARSMLISGIAIANATGSRPVPHPPHHEQDQDRVDQHRERHRDAVRAAEVVGVAETDHQQNHRDEQHPVHERHVDLADLALGGVVDGEPRAVAHLNRRARQRERAGDHRLRRDHGRASSRGAPAGSAPRSAPADRTDS